ncbi:MAG: LCP family protein [Chloroflexi bacterium]|nr:LCP family protein [Chloroflexota bacterium]
MKLRTKAYGLAGLLLITLLVCVGAASLSSSLVRTESPAPDTDNMVEGPAAPELNPAAPPPAAVAPDLFDEAIAPVIEAALAMRAARAQSEPGYGTRIDPDINRNRLNVLFFGYGETYEPPLPVDIIGTMSILSLDTRTHKLTQISLTHDARAPEIERYMTARGQSGHPAKIDTAYRHGGFTLMREAVENATGLVIDFQITLEDTFIGGLVDETLGAIEIDAPIEIETNPIYLKGVQRSCRKFPQGKQTLDGTQTLCYLKGLSLPPYDPRKENNLRKQIVLQGLKDAVQKNLANPVFSVKMIGFLQGQLERKTVAYDFDAPKLLFASIKHMATNATFRPILLPALDQNIYLVDENIGDGGFAWVLSTQNPLIRDEVKRGIYKDVNMVVTNGDPYAADLAKGYWGSTRYVIRTRFLRYDSLIVPLIEHPLTVPRVRRVPQSY